MKKFETIKIKELIIQFPEIEKILIDYDIQCLKCKGNCALKEIVENENISMKNEIELMSKIQEVIDEKQ